MCYALIPKAASAHLTALSVIAIYFRIIFSAYLNSETHLIRKHLLNISQTNRDKIVRILEGCSFIFGTRI